MGMIYLDGLRDPHLALKLEARVLVINMSYCASDESAAVSLK